MPFFDRSIKKINILDNVVRSSVCLTVAVIFALLRWWGKSALFSFFLPSLKLASCFSFLKKVKASEQQLK